MRGRHWGSKEPAAAPAPDALSKLQADRLGNVVEALKLRFRISIEASRELKRLLGAGAGADQAEEEEDEVPPVEEDPQRLSGQAEQKAAAAPSGSPREAEHCTKGEFAQRLHQELVDCRLSAQKGGGPASAAADAFYRRLEGPREPPWPRPAASDDGEPSSPAVLRGESLRAAHEGAALSLERICSDEGLGPQALLDAMERELFDKLLWAEAEVKNVFTAWLEDAGRLRGGLSEARLHLKARQAWFAFDEERMGEDDLLAFVRALEEHHKAMAGGQGPAVLGAALQNWGEHRERQTIAHLLHCIIFYSRKWIPRARWGKAGLSRRWAKRTAAALVHICFHTAHLEIAEAAAEMGSEDPDLKAIRDAIADFRPLKYDRDSTFLLYFSGRIQNLQRPMRPVILVLTCSFGGGHRAAAQAVSSYFAGLAEVQIIDTSKDSEFLEKDLVYKLGQRIGRPNWDQTTWFNDVILKRQLYGWVNVSEGFGKVQGAILEDGRRSGIAPPLRSPEGDSTLKRILRGQFLSYHPSLVITVYHMDINPIMALCEELGSLPLLHCATDLDVKMWEVFGRTQPLYSKFCVGVPFNATASWDSVSPLSGAQVFLAGYPVRTQFLAPRPSAEALEDARETPHGLRPGERLVLVMTGGGGQEVPWPEWLANSTTWGRRAGGAVGSGQESAPEERLRVVVIAGKNAALVKRLKGVLKEDRSTGRELLRGSNDRVSVQIARDPNPEAVNPFFVGAAELASLMDVASAAITKPGGGSTSELTYRRVPVVLDASKGAMHWEEFTIKRFEEARCGVALRRRDSKELEAALRQCLDFQEATLAVDPRGALLDTGIRLRARASMLTGLAALRRQGDEAAAEGASPPDEQHVQHRAGPDVATSTSSTGSTTSSSAEPPGCNLLGGARWWPAFRGRVGPGHSGGEGWEAPTRSGPCL